MASRSTTSSREGEPSVQGFLAGAAWPRPLRFAASQPHPETSGGRYTVDQLVNDQFRIELQSASPNNGLALAAPGFTIAQYAGVALLRFPKGVLEPRFGRGGLRQLFNDPTSGLFQNVFTLDPRMCGVQLTQRF